MPLAMAKSGEANIIRRIGGRDETKRFLESLGFVVGGEVTVMNEIGGNMIVSIKDCRVAIDKSMAMRIIV